MNIDDYQSYSNIMQSIKNSLNKISKHSEKEEVIKEVESINKLLALSGKREDRNILLINELLDAMNLCGNDREFGETLSKKIIYYTHRTIIQNFFRMIKKVIETYSKEEHFDARNQGSLEWAKEVAKIQKYLPNI